ncbi:hypothetical protein [Microbacterium luticocti]|uniref:hypothetical protein n=1 Tax=Microbacterium luticocti TaxID=451764 RepID=UPI001469B9D5|nr:hypothetical protein [Microbacterium luticocti]
MQRRARVLVIAVMAAIVLAVGAGAPAWADSTSDMTQIDTQLGKAMDTFTAVYGDSSASLSDAEAAARDFEKAAAKAQKDFQRVADGEQNKDLAAYGTKFAGIAGDMASAAKGIGALSTQDESALSKAESAMNDAIDAYSSTADEYNEFIKTLPANPTNDPAFVLWLTVLIVGVVYLLLTLLFALLTRKQQGLLPAKVDKKGTVQQASLSRLRWMVVLWAGVFVVGAAIPFVQVIVAEMSTTGEYTYRVFWYPLAIGAALSVIGLVQYFVAAAKVRREGSAQPHDPSAMPADGMPVPVGPDGVPVAPAGTAAPPAYAVAPGQPAPAVPPAPGQPTPGASGQTAPTDPAAGSAPGTQPPAAPPAGPDAPQRD